MEHRTENNTITFELSREHVALMMEALDSQVRLLDSYVNKGPDQIIHLQKFKHLQYLIREVLLRE